MKKRILFLFVGLILVCSAILVCRSNSAVSASSERTTNRSSQAMPGSATFIESGEPLTATHLLYLPYIARSADPTPSPSLHWELVGPAGEERVLDIDIAPDDRYLYTATPSGIYRTLDKGLTWELCRSGYFRSLVIDPVNPNIVYAGPGVCKSTDGGNSWECYSEGMTDTNVASLAIATTDPNILFTGSF